MSPRLVDPGTVRRRTGRALGDLKAQVLGAVATARVLAARPHRQRRPPAGGSLPEHVSLVLSFRAATAERVEVMETVVRTVDQQVGATGVPLLVRDSSPPNGGTDAVFRSLVTPVRYEQDELPLGRSYQALLASCTTPYFCLQFDDQLTTGFGAAFLEGACGLLHRHAGLVDLVAVLRPLACLVDDDTRSIDVVAQRMGRPGRRPTWRFGGGLEAKALFVEEHAGLRFGIFPNFGYGFFFNHLVAPVADYARRLDWYLEHVSTTSAHDIETAAARRSLGPAYRHLAVCLDGTALLDLDFAHTPSAVRPDDPESRRVFEAVRSGYDVVVT